MIIIVTIIIQQLIIVDSSVCKVVGLSETSTFLFVITRSENFVNVTSIHDIRANITV